MAYLITLALGIIIGIFIGTGNLSLSVDTPELDAARAACEAVGGNYADGECLNPNSPTLQP